MPLFSERLGFTTPKELQLQNIDIPLKNRIWNILKMFVFDRNPIKGGNNSIGVFKIAIYHNFLKLNLDDAPDDTYTIKEDFKYKYFRFPWFQIYDFIDFTIANNLASNVEIFTSALNNVFESEFSGYRIFNNQVCPISNETETDEIKTAFSNLNKYSTITEANAHLGKAVEHLSRRPNPDYSNSIKESISAVETAARIITGENNLGNALRKIETKIPAVNGQLKESFNKIYNYTNAPDNGIRHAKIQGGAEPDFETAKYLLVTSCAFINYIVGLSVKSGILI